VKGDAQALAEFEVVRYKAIVKEKFQARIPKNRISTTTRDTSFPFYVGKQWRDSYKPTIFRNTFHNITNSEVVAEQQVATQAGNFRSLRIERTEQAALSYAPSGTSFMATTRGAYYYCPETKSIVKYDLVGDRGNELHIELLKFAPAH